MPSICRTLISPTLSGHSGVGGLVPAAVGSDHRRPALPAGAVGEALALGAVQHHRAGAVEVVGHDVHPAGRRIRRRDRVVVPADLALPAAFESRVTLRLGQCRPIALRRIGFHQPRGLWPQIFGGGHHHVVLAVDLHHARRQLRRTRRRRVGEQRLVGAGDAVVAHPGRVVDRVGLDVQRDRRVPAAEADALAGEAVTAHLQDAARELHELAQIGGADAVIPCRRAGSGGRPDAQHLAGRQRRQDRLRNRRRRIGVGGRAQTRQPTPRSTKWRQLLALSRPNVGFGAQAGHSSAASSSAI